MLTIIVKYGLKSQNSMFNSHAKCWRREDLIYCSWFLIIFRLQSLHICKCFSKLEMSAKLMVQNHLFFIKCFINKARSLKLYDIFFETVKILTIEHCGFFIWFFHCTEEVTSRSCWNLYICQNFIRKCPLATIFEVRFFFIKCFSHAFI